MVQEGLDFGCERCGPPIGGDLRRAWHASENMFGKVGALHHTPYTLHPTPYTLHPTPYTLHLPCPTRWFATSRVSCCLSRFGQFTRIGHIPGGAAATSAGRWPD